MHLPLMATIKQHSTGHSIRNAGQEVKLQIHKMNLKQRILPGQQIGITVGSRGIKNIVQIIKELAMFVKLMGAKPVLIPSMGSHGGGNPEGRLSLLNKLGITKKSTGADIIPHKGEVLLTYTSTGVPVYINRAALECDGIIVANRIKPHTSFKGTVESGIQKMLAVGLGGPKGAAVIHSAGAHALAERISAIAKEMLNHLPVILAIAIIENARGETMQICPVLPEDIVETEKQLLKIARLNMPSLPVDNIDLLIVDQMGKNFSGTGMDTNIIGRIRVEGVPEPGHPQIKRVIVLDLSEKSNGNANGIGLADFTTSKLVNKIDLAVTYKNALTSKFFQRVMIPITMKNDYEAIVAAFKTLYNSNYHQAKVVRIKNTLELSEVQVSEFILKNSLSNQFSIIKALSPMKFDKHGNLYPF